MNLLGGGMSGGAVLTFGGGGRNGGGGMFGGSGPGGKKFGGILAAVGSVSDVECSEITCSTTGLVRRHRRQQPPMTLKCFSFRVILLIYLDIVALEVVSASSFNPAYSGCPSTNHINGATRFPAESM